MCVHACVCVSVVPFVCCVCARVNERVLKHMRDGKEVEFNLC